MDFQDFKGVNRFKNTVHYTLYNYQTYTSIAKTKL